MDEEKIERVKEFKENVEKKFLVINRIDPKVRQAFVDLSNDGFCGDYGQVLHWLMEQANEYQFMKTQIFGDVDIKLNYIINLLENNENKTQEKTIKTFGKILKI